MFTEAIDALGDALEEVAGELVLYTSATTGATASLPAVPGRSIVQDEQSDGTIIQVLSIDWLVFARKLIANGQPIAPAKGDTITWTTPAGTQLVYELMSPPYAPADHLGVRLRLHSLLISSNA